MIIKIKINIQFFIINTEYLFGKSSNPISLEYRLVLKLSTIKKNKFFYLTFKAQAIAF